MPCLLQISVIFVPPSENEPCHLWWGMDVKRFPFLNREKISVRWLLITLEPRDRWTGHEECVFFEEDTRDVPMEDPKSEFEMMEMSSKSSKYGVELLLIILELNGLYQKDVACICVMCIHRNH